MRYELINQEEIRRISKTRRTKKFFKLSALLLVILSAFGFGLHLGGLSTQTSNFVEREELMELLAGLQHQQEENLREQLAFTEGLLLENSAYNNAADIFRAVDNSVVSINVVTQNRSFAGIRESTSAGSGIIFHETNEHIYIVTNYHVVQGANSVTVSLDDVREAQAHYVGSEARSDIAVISVSRQALLAAGISDYKVASFGDSDLMEIGNFVLAVGNAYGEGKSATLGIVSAIDKNITLENGVHLNVMQTDAAINPGNSGGPLVNTRGEVIGINTARLITARSEGMGYAIPSNAVEVILEQIMSSGDSIATPFLGVSIGTLTESTREYHGFAEIGVFVGGITPGYAAESMGILPGDIITHFAGERVYTSESLGRLIVATEPGSTVFVTINRDGQSINLTGTMTSFIPQNRTRF